MKEESNELTSKLECVSNHLYKLYSTLEPYDVYPDAKRFLEHLKTLQMLQVGYGHPPLKLGIISNYDKRIINVLRELCIFDCFDFITYSEGSQCSKPQKEIFIDAVRTSGIDNLRNEEILHIGDDFKKDYTGASNMGWNAFLIVRDSDDPIHIEKSKIHPNSDSKEIQNVLKYEQSDSKLRENPQMFYDVCDSFDEVKEKIVQ